MKQQFGYARFESVLVAALALLMIATLGVFARAMLSTAVLV